MTTQPTRPKRMSRLRLFGLFFSLPLSALLIANAYSRLQERKADEHRAALTQSLGSLCAAASLYAQENGDRLPPADTWQAALARETGPLPLRLPANPGGKSTCIALNRALQGRRLDSIAKPSQAILFFESTSAGPNACDALESLVSADEARPLMFGFADGHIEEIVPATLRADVLARSQTACQPPVTPAVSGHGSASAPSLHTAPQNAPTAKP